MTLLGRYKHYLITKQQNFIQLNFNLEEKQFYSYFLPKSAGFSPHNFVSHFNTGLL